MKKGLGVRALTRFTGGVVMVAAMLFWPAGSWGYWNGWLLMAVLFIPIAILGAVMLRCAPELLDKRLSNKENQEEQRYVVALSALMFVASFVVAGLNYRYGWHTLPDVVVWMATVVFLIAYALYAEVMRENAYLSRTVEIQQGQRLVDSGLYGIVRHPMYTATVLLFLSMPLILGSILSFVIMLVYIPLIALRIVSEERLLKQGLPGYKVYTQRVKYRLIPYVW